MIEAVEIDGWDVFEVDQVSLQANKKLYASSAGLPTEHIHYVTGNFETTEDWLD